MKELEPIIGLEIHAELNTVTKMFCGCANDPNERHPNINVCPICMGHPGTLPVINESAVEKVALIGMALHGEIAKFSQFDRKQYFYPDLPKGYQISQYKHPIVQGGYLEIPNSKFLIPNLQSRTIHLTRIHLEEDAGRLLHTADASLVDFNRAGVPLMELVTEPDVRTAEEARLFAEELRLHLRYTGVSDANMEKGQMRIEANISLHKAGEPYGTKVEVKNINSFRAVEKAIEYEIARQTALIENGENIAQETRGWDDEKEITVSQRKKESAHDYRYFPEPDLPPLQFSFEFLENVQKKFPELPADKRKRFREEFGIAEKVIEIIILDKNFAGFFESAVSELISTLKETEGVAETKKGIILLANYFTSDLIKLLNESSAPISDIRITPHSFAELIALVTTGTITSSVAKQVLDEMFRSGADARAVVRDKNLSVIENTEELARAVEEVIKKSERAVLDYKNGKKEVMQFFIGSAMKVLRGRGNPDTLKDLFVKKLGN
ncbi:MAG: Asp-tRNA(Asn)/Glu-tRNA(Gln) amidotransferase subunit GatB [Patescibacteria group bacterium]